MQRPKAVIFDLGKVLLDFDYHIAAKNLAAHCTVPASELVTILNQSALLHRYETGLLTTNEFFEEVRRLSSFCHGLDRFEPIFGDIFSPIEEMIALNESLRQRKIPTYIFSNTNEMAICHIRRTYPFFQNFNGHILSYEHRAMKPQPEIYEVMERQSGFKGADLLYIDDRPENVEQGSARAWKTIHHHSPAETISVTHRLLGLNTRT